MLSSFDLHDYFEKRSKCVGIAKHNGNIYYAISGEDGKKTQKFAREIEAMLGASNLVRCYIKDTFTVLKLKNYKLHYYTYLEDYIYDCIYTSGRAIFVFPEYLGSRIKFKKFMLNCKQWYDMSNFSCVERKIIGTVGKQSVDITVGLRPCYKCLPIIKNVTYYDQVHHKVHSIKSSRSINVFTFKKIF